MFDERIGQFRHESNSTCDESLMHSQTVAHDQRSWMVQRGA